MTGRRLLRSLIAGILACNAAGVEAGGPDTAKALPGRIDIVSVEDKFSSSFELDRFTPSGDSCADLIVGLREKANAWARFSYDRDRRWQFDKIGYYDSSRCSGGIRVNVSLDKEMRFVKARIVVTPRDDSLRLFPAASLQKGDLPAPADSGASLRFFLERKSFFCEPQHEATIVERKFTYPIWYMRREPQMPNYPELSMFHYGESVRLPTYGSIRTRAFIMNYWHILQPPELEYETKRKK